MPAEQSPVVVAPPLADTLLAAPGSAFVIAEWTDLGGGFDPPLYIAPPHRHRQDDEAWYVLEGTLRVQIDGMIHEVPAGAGVMAPRGTVHTFWNPQPEPTRYLIVMTANIKALIDALHALPEWSPDAVRDLMARHATDLID